MAIEPDQIRSGVGVGRDQNEANFHRLICLMPRVDSKG
jgi:hypothetical protein